MPKEMESYLTVSDSCSTKLFPNTFWLFTLGQLAEIQKVSLARIICDNSDGTVGYIQPKAFRTPHEYVH